MNLWFIIGLLILGVCSSASGIESCDRDNNGPYPKAVCYSRRCTTAIEEHIEKELHAAFQYLYMGAVFGQYTMERPGMAKFFLESATEERGHAVQMMDYLNMRGIPYTKAYTFVNEVWDRCDGNITEVNLSNCGILSALEEALQMEITVTKSIDAVIRDCADDYHGADVFTNPILEEQHVGIRKLQGAIRTIKELLKNQGESGQRFAEFLFDQKMLKGEL